MSCTTGSCPKSFEMPHLRRDLSRVSRWLGRVCAGQGGMPRPDRGEDSQTLAATPAGRQSGWRTEENHPLWGHHRRMAISCIASQITLWRARNMGGWGVHVQKTVRPIHLQDIAWQSERVWASTTLVNMSTAGLPHKSIRRAVGSWNPETILYSSPPSKDSPLRLDDKRADQPEIWTAIRLFLDVWHHWMTSWSNRYKLLNLPPPPQSCSDRASLWCCLSELGHEFHTATSGMSLRQGKLSPAQDSWYTNMTRLPSPTRNCTATQTSSTCIGWELRAVGKGLPGRLDPAETKIPELTKPPAMTEGPTWRADIPVWWSGLSWDSTGDKNETCTAELENYMTPASLSDTWRKHWADTWVKRSNSRVACTIVSSLAREGKTTPLAVSIIVPI